MTARRTILPALALIAAMASSEGGCKISRSPSPSPSAAASGAGTADPIVIGVSLGLSGELSGLSASLQRSIRVAEQYINSVGGVLNRPVSFNVVDDASEIDQAKKVASRFVDQSVIGVLGPVESSQALQVTQLLATHEIIQVSATAATALLTLQQPARDRWFFRTAPSDERQGKIFADFVFNGPEALSTRDAGTADADDGGTRVPSGCRTLAVVSVDDEDAIALGTIIKTSFKALGGTVVLDQRVPFDAQREYRALADLVVAAHPDCHALLVYPTIGGKFMIDLRRAIAADTSNHDWTKFFVAATDDAHSDDLITASQLDPSNPLSPAATENVYGTVADTAPETADYTAFVKLYTASYPLEPGITDPPPFTANQFDAALLLALAIEQAGTATDKALIRDALYLVSKGGKAHGPGDLVNALSEIRGGADIDYAGASGEVDFDDYGNVNAGFVIWRNEKQPNGTFKLVTLHHVKDGL